MVDGIRVGGASVSHTRPIGRSRRQAAARDASPPGPSQQSPDTEDSTPPAKPKSRAETRRRRGIRPKTDLSGKSQADSAGKTQLRRKPKRRVPGPRPNKPQEVRSPEVPPPAPAPREQSAPPLTTPPSQPFSSGWRAWVRKQRRLLSATALGFLAGLLVYALLGPEETPSPQKAANAGQERAAKRGTSHARDPAERASRQATARPRHRTDYVPAAGYSTPSTLGGSYSSRPNSAPQTYGAYPGTAYAPGLANEQYVPDRYRPTQPDAPYAEDQWPSSTGRSTQRTFKQPLGGIQYGGNRPWGSVDDRLQSRQPRPQVPRGYPPVVDPYAPLPDYPDPPAGPPANEWAPGGYYQSGRPAPY